MSTSATEYTELEHKLIQLSQGGLPITANPYKKLAEELEMPEEDILAVLQAMKEKGIIRRIGLVPNHYAIGYTYNLMTVWDIKDSDIDQVGEQVGQLDFVSHCYRRPRHLPDWPYNFFAMVHGKSEMEAEQKMQIIKRVIGSSCEQFTALKSTKILKKTGLRI